MPHKALGKVYWRAAMKCLASAPVMQEPLDRKRANVVAVIQSALESQKRKVFGFLSDYFVEK